MNKALNLYETATVHARKEQVRNLKEALEGLSNLAIKLCTHRAELDRLATFGKQVSQTIYHHGPAANPTNLTCNPTYQTGELYDVLEIIERRITILHSMATIDPKKLYYRAAAAFLNKNVEI